MYGASIVSSLVVCSETLGLPEQRSSSQTARTWATGLILGLLVGCGGGVPDAPKLVPAAGTLSQGGKPLAKVAVVLQPDKGPPATGTTDADGKFELKTGGQPGAVVGTHRVTLAMASSGEMPPADGNVTQLIVKPIFAAKYLDAQKTDLKAEIPAAGNKELKLEAAAP